jgi:RNA polymerase sigma-70 factor (ECF subfamily)
MVVLLDLEDFTYEEIAAIAGIPIGTVRSRLFRARQILQAKLLEYASKQGFRSQDDDDAVPQGRTNDVSKS